MKPPALSASRSSTRPSLPGRPIPGPTDGVRPGGAGPPHLYPSGMPRPHPSVQQQENQDQEVQDEEQQQPDEQNQGEEEEEQNEEE